MGGKGRNGRIRTGFSGDVPYGRGDLQRRQLKLKANQDANPITEVAVLKINETDKIRELYRAICEIPETPNETELKMKKETEMNGKLRSKS